MSLRYSPPLIVDAESVDTAIRIFGESLSAAKRPERGPAGPAADRTSWPMRPVLITGATAAPVVAAAAFLDAGWQVARGLPTGTAGRTAPA